MGIRWKVEKEMTCWKCGTLAQYHDDRNNNMPVCSDCSMDRRPEYTETCPHCDLEIFVN